MKLILLFTLLLACPVLGQQPDSLPALPDKTNFKSSVLIEWGLSRSLIRLPAIHAFFESNQIERPKGFNDFATLAIGYRQQRFKALLQSFFGIDSRLLPPDEPVDKPLIARRVNSGNLGLLLGYDVANLRNHRLFVHGGVGTIRYEYSVFRPSNQPTSFQHVLQNDPTGSVPSLIYTSGYWETVVEMTQREKRPMGFGWAARLGYRRSLKATAWRSDAYTWTDAPTDRISQFYLQVGLFFSHNFRNRPDR
ncbi:hypothetical protein ACO2Q8_12835 [Larkinella sp. VNQ87]|uniref:hypothetical protein n=1 Tax=Larkinella sp. VNQ87 TaxID=3400921 RepID=UPI003C0936EF